MITIVLFSALLIYTMLTGIRANAPQIELGAGIVLLIVYLLAIALGVLANIEYRYVREIYIG